MKEEKFYEVHEIAYKLKSCTSTIYRLIESGKLQAINIGNGTERNSYRISHKNYDNFINSIRK